MTSNASPSTIPGLEIDLREYARLFWSQRWVILAFALVFTAGAAAWSLRMKPVFISTSKFITKTGGGGGPGAELAGLAKLGGFSLPDKQDQDPLAHIDEIARNVDFLEKVLERKWAVGGDSLTLPQIWGAKPDTTKPDWPFRFKMANIERLREGVLDFGNEGGLRLLTTKAESPELACRLNEYMLDLVNDYMSRNVKSQAGENRKFVEERIAEVRTELTESENALSAFHRSNLNLTSPQVALQYKRLQRNVAINEEVFLQLKKEYELARIQEKKDEPLVIVVKRPEVALSRAKPNRKAIVAGGLFFGLATGFLAAAARLIFRRP